jgi:hypothetical protein
MELFPQSMPSLLSINHDALTYIWLNAFSIQKRQSLARVFVSDIHQLLHRGATELSEADTRRVITANGNAYSTNSLELQSKINQSVVEFICQ